MAFAFTTESDPYENWGRKKVVYGTYSNGTADSGGEIDTGLTRVEFMKLQPTGAAAIATASTVNETMPFDGSSVTVVTAADEDGVWMAVGY